MFSVKFKNNDLILASNELKFTFKVNSFGKQKYIYYNNIYYKYKI